MGINVFDTAQAYGFGTAEEVLGEALRDEISHRRGEIVIATKGGLRTDDVFHGRTFRRNLAVVDRLEELAGAKGCSVAQLAVAWTLSHPAVDCAIVGAPTPEGV